MLISALQASIIAVVLAVALYGGGASARAYGGGGA